MSAPGVVVHCKRSAYDVLVDRTTPFGNPFIINARDTRADVIAKFERYARARIRQDKAWAAQVLELRGRVLGCWCAPKPCHGDVLLQLADELFHVEQRDVDRVVADSGLTGATVNVPL